MISAKLAYEDTRQNINNRVESEAKIVEAEVKKAIREGKYSTTIDGSVSTETREWLKGLGYSVQTGSQYNASYTCIKWS